MAAFGRTQLLKLAQMSSMSLNGAGSATRTMGAGQLGLGDSQKRFKSKTSRLAKVRSLMAKLIIGLNIICCASLFFRFSLKRNMGDDTRSRCSLEEVSDPS